MKHRRPPRSVGAKTERCAVYHAGGRRRACGTRRPDLRLCRSQRTILWRWGGAPPPPPSAGGWNEMKQETPKKKKKAGGPPVRPAKPVSPRLHFKEKGGGAGERRAGD